MTVETPDPTSSVLPRCASGPDNFYMLTSANQMTFVFYSIGNVAVEVARREVIRQIQPRKSPATMAGLFDFENSVCLVSGGRGELRDHAFDRLEGLLGEVGIKPCDLLRLRYEGLVG